MDEKNSENQQRAALFLLSTLLSNFAVQTLHDSTAVKFGLSLRFEETKPIGKVNFVSTKRKPRLVCGVVHFARNSVLMIAERTIKHRRYGSLDLLRWR
jgi:hypothetical protein